MGRWSSRMAGATEAMDLPPQQALPEQAAALVVGAAPTMVCMEPAHLVRALLGVIALQGMAAAAAERRPLALVLVLAWAARGLPAALPGHRLHIPLAAALARAELDLGTVAPVD